MRRLDTRLDFRSQDIRAAIETLKNAQAEGFTHAIVSVAKYVQTQPKPKKNEAPIERGGQPGRYRPNGQPGKLRSITTNRDLFDERS